MNKEAIKNKTIYLLSLLGMCLVLILVAYFFFLRTIPVDLTRNVALIYSGENGRASVEAINNTEDLNQRIQEFYDTVQYTVDPDHDLSNGEKIVIHASYDESLAQEYHFQPKNIEKELTVEGLPDRFGSKAEIDPNWIAQIQGDMNAFMKDHVASILAYEGEGLQTLSDDLVYFAFLKSNVTENSDKFIGVYKIEYAQEETIETLYYMVLVPDINESMRIETQNIYGERAYLSEEENEQGRYGEYIQRVFGSQYVIEQEESGEELEKEKEGDDPESDR